MTTSESRGSSTVTSLRLCSRAPVTTMEFWRRHKTASQSTAAPDGKTRTGVRFPLGAGNSDRGGQQPGVQQLALAGTSSERLHAQLLARSRGAAARAGRACGRGGGCCRAATRAAARSRRPRSAPIDRPAASASSALPQLRGHQVPDRVRREVADHPGAPVDVLQHALGVARDLEAEQPVRRPRSTRPGRSSTASRALDQRELELEAQRDVEVVGRLVGLDPDQRRPDLVDGAVEAAGRRARRTAPGNWRRS